MASPSVVYIEDDPDMQAIVKNRVEKVFNAGFRAFDQGLPAIEHLKAAEPPTVILVDLQLPDISGFEVVYRIRNETKAENSVILVLSARTGLDDYARAEEVGATGYLEKPLQIKHLEAELKRHFDKAAKG